MRRASDLLGRDKPQPQQRNALHSEQHAHQQSIGRVERPLGLHRTQPALDSHGSPAARWKGITAAVATSPNPDRCPLRIPITTGPPAPTVKTTRDTANPPQSPVAFEANPPLQKLLTGDQATLNAVQAPVRVAGRHPGGWRKSRSTYPGGG